MANHTSNAYGIGSPLINVFPSPIVTTRNPAASDLAEIGQIWINTATQASFILAAVQAGGAVWVGNPAGGDAGVFTDLSATGIIDLDSGAIGTDFVLRSTGANSDINITNVQSAINIDSSENDPNAITMNAGNGGINVTADSDFAVATGGRITFAASEAANNAIQMTTNDGTGGILLEAADGGFTVTATQNGFANIQVGDGGINLDCSNGTGGGEIDITAGTDGLFIQSNGTLEMSVVNGDNLEITSNGDLDITSTNDAAGCVAIEADAGTSETILIRSNQGTDNSSIDIQSLNGGISLDCVLASNFTVTGAGEDLTLNSVGGSVALTATENTGEAVFLLANGGAAETIVIQSSQGTTNGSVALVSVAGGVQVQTAALAATTGLQLTQGAATIPIQVGAGIPAHNAPQGTLYLRTDGTTTNDRAYINTNGTNGWTAIITAA